MKKLYNLKKWYSLQESCERLTITLGEKITIQDIANAVLDGYTPIYWDIRHRTAMPVSLDTRKINTNLFKKNIKNNNALSNDLVVTGYFPTQDHVEVLSGIYKLELSLCGALTDHIKAIATGVPSDVTTIDGFFVSDEDGQLYRIEDSFPHEVRIITPNTNLNIYHRSNYYPSNNFPEPYELGFKKENIEDFEKLFDQKINVDKNDISNKERDTYHNIIGSLLGLILGKSSSGKPYSQFTNQQSIIDAIHANYGDRHGLSKSNLERKFAESNRLLKSNYPDST